MDPVNSHYGVDHSSPAPIDAQSEDVTIPEINSDLAPEVIMQLRQQVDRLAPSLNHGIELYEQTLSMLQS